MKNIVKKIFYRMFFIYHSSMQKIKKTRKILIFCNGKQMEEHIVDYVRAIGGTHYRLYLLLNYDDKNMGNDLKNMVLNYQIKMVTHKVEIYLTNWNLIVSADIETPRGYVSQRIVPLLYINHGLHIISYDDGETTYAYGKESCKDRLFGQPKFSAMLESNRLIQENIIREHPELAGVIHHVGWKFYDVLQKEQKSRVKYREQIGVSDKETLVFVVGTWNRYSLFHVLGEQIFDEMIRLKSQGYQFVLSIHPLEYLELSEYAAYNPEGIPLGKEVDKQEQYGLKVRKITEDWIPYMIASDIVIADYSSMYENAIMAGKKLIMSDFPEKTVYKNSLAVKAKQLFPIISNANQLEKILDKVKEEPINKNILEMKKYFKSNEDYKQKVRQITQAIM